MKTFSATLASLLIVALSSCANHHPEEMMTVGEVSEQKLLSSHQSFSQSYRALTLSEQEIIAINQWPNDLHIEVYFGTWCHDSQREVPKFLKMLTEKSTLSYRLIALDYQKSEPNGSAKNHDIKFTPTFVIYQNNQEIGRIIERPTVSIAADISAML